MATAQFSPLLRHIQRLAAGRSAPPWTDRRLLDEFAARRDEQAFAALVARHGAMVLRVCRRVLGHEQDAEDAFQAVFLVLARNARSIHKREALGGWLHGVAYRTAMKVKRGAARRRRHEARLGERTPPPAAGPSWDDVRAVLDEEVRRLPEAFRSAFVLCALEGKSGPEAAAELGCREGTVKSRVNRARRQLRQRLAGRGIQLAALLAALSAAESAGRAAVSAALARVTIRLGLSVAAGEPAAAFIPSHVADLAAGVTRAMFLTKARTITAVLLAAALLIAGAGALARQALAARERPAENPPSEVGSQKPQPAVTKPEEEKGESVAVSGRVVDPDGKPFAGARLYLNYFAARGKDRPARATSGADGAFSFTFKRSALDESSPNASWYQVIAVAEGHGPDWAYATKPVASPNLVLRLVKDLPIQGRILDLNGRPVQGATLRVEHIDAYADPEAFLQTVRDREWPLVDSRGWAGPFPGQPATLTTGADGRFRLTGVGRDRVVTFQLEGPGIQYGPVCALARELKAAAEPRPMKYGPNITKVYGATFDHAALPSRLIRGVVRDKRTGRPVAEVGVSAMATTHRTRSDDEGRYELLGCPKSADGYRVSFAPEARRYFHASVTFADTPGLDPVQADMELVGGIAVKGRVTHQVTGRPLAGARVHYNPLYPNPFVRWFGPDGAGIAPCSWAEAGPDGSYELVVLPGPGVLGFMAHFPEETFMPALVTSQELKDFFKDNGDHGNEDRLRIQASVNGTGAIGQVGYNHLLLINPGEKDEALTRDVALRPARPVPGKVVGPDGKRLAGVAAYDLAPGILSQRLEGDTFTVEGLNPRRTRHLVFIDKDRKHGAFLSLTGEVKEPLTVRLHECGSATGRLLDQDGQPAAGATVRLEPESLPDSGPARVKTDAQGRFRIDGLVPGQKYQARHGLPPFGQYLFAPFAVEPGQSKDLGEGQLKPKP
jgi:RNA polymerase sigma factor (sigma-70 family)